MEKFTLLSRCFSSSLTFRSSNSSCLILSSKFSLASNAFRFSAVSSATCRDSLCSWFSSVRFWLVHEDLISYKWRWASSSRVSKSLRSCNNSFILSFSASADVKRARDCSEISSLVVRCRISSSFADSCVISWFFSNCDERLKFSNSS